MTPDLSKAASTGNLAEVERLIEAGADVNVIDSFGSYPLHDAARFGQDEVCQVLLSSGAKVNATGVEEQSALHYAAMGGNPNTISLLIEAGAIANAVNEYGATPLVMAIRRHASDDDSQKERLFVCEALIDAGADPKLMNPLYCAVQSTCCDHDLVRLLVHRGAELSEVEASPLGLAVQSYNQAQYELKTSTESHFIAYEMARDGAWDTVSLLVELGADLDHKYVVESWDGDQEEVSAADRLQDVEVRKLRAVQEKRMLEQNTMAASSLARSTLETSGAWCPSPQQAEDFADRMTTQAQVSTHEAAQQHRPRMRL